MVPANVTKTEKIKKVKSNIFWGTVGLSVANEIIISNGKLQG